MLRGDDLLIEGRLRHVCVDTKGWQKTELPDWVRSGLRRFAAANAESSRRLASGRDRSRAKDVGVVAGYDGEPRVAHRTQALG